MIYLVTTSSHLASRKGGEKETVRERERERDKQRQRDRDTQRVKTERERVHVRKGTTPQKEPTSHKRVPIGCHLLFLAVDKSRYLAHQRLTSPGKKSRYWEILCLTRIVRLPLRPVTAQTRSKPVTNYLSRRPRASTEVGSCVFCLTEHRHRHSGLLLACCKLSLTLTLSVCLSLSVPGLLYTELVQELAGWLPSFTMREPGQEVAMC